jgi:NADPH:quinone reductase-like Zn-dependent oxidoreductase
VKVGDHVLAPNLGLTWTERLIAQAQGLFPLPDGDRLQLAQLGSNPPTAALILSEYADLKPGDWVVQNAGNSGVGRSLIAIAKLRGISLLWHPMRRAGSRVPVFPSMAGRNSN